MKNIVILEENCVLLLEALPDGKKLQTARKRVPKGGAKPAILELERALTTADSLKFY